MRRTSHSRYRRLKAMVVRHAEGVDEVVHERLGGDVQDGPGREVLLDVVPDGVEEVGLAQPGVAVDEQRVVGASGRLGHRLGGGVGQAVRRGGDEGVEGEAGVERDRGGLPASSGDAAGRPVLVTGRVSGGSGRDSWAAGRRSGDRVRAGAFVAGRPVEELELDMDGRAGHHRPGSPRSAAGTGCRPGPGRRGWERRATMAPSPNEIGSMSDSHICHVVSDTCSRKDAAHRVHSPLVSSTCSSARHAVVRPQRGPQVWNIRMTVVGRTYTVSVSPTSGNPT